MRILISNDDGIEAEGIWILAREIANRGHHTIIACPMRQQSGMSHALTILQRSKFQLRFRQARLNFRRILNQSKFFWNRCVIGNCNGSIRRNSIAKFHMKKIDSRCLMQFSRE